MVLREIEVNVNAQRKKTTCKLYRPKDQASLMSCPKLASSTLSFISNIPYVDLEFHL